MQLYGLKIVVFIPFLIDVYTFFTLVVLIKRKLVYFFFYNWTNFNKIQNETLKTKVFTLSISTGGELYLTEKFWLIKKKNV